MNSDDLYMPYLGTREYVVVWLNSKEGVYPTAVVDTVNNIEVGIKCASRKNKAKYLINI